MPDHLRSAQFDGTTRRQFGPDPGHLVQRFRGHHHPLSAMAVVEAWGIAVRRVARGEQPGTIGPAGGKAHMGRAAMPARQPFHLPHGAGHCPDRISRHPMPEGDQEDRLAFGRAEALRIKMLGDHRVQTLAEPIVPARLTVMHEAPPAMAERVAIVARCLRPGRGAYMRHEKARLRVMGKLFQIGIGPCGAGILVETGHCALGRIPGQPEPVRIDRSLADQRIAALLDQRLFLLDHQLLKIARRARPGEEPAHQAAVRAKRAVDSSQL